METSSAQKGGLHYAWVIMLCGCAIVGTSLGVVGYTIGNFFLPLSRDLGAYVGTVAFYQTMTSFASAFMFPIARKLMGKYNIRIVLSCAAIFLCAAFVGMSLCTQLWQIYACAVCIGLCTAFFSGVTVPMLIGNWFYKNNGTIYGLCLAFAAIVGALMNPVIAKIIAAYSWRMGYRAIAAAAAALLLPATALFVRLKPSDKGLKPYGYDESLPASVAERSKSGVPAEVAFRSKAFLATLVAVPCFGIIFALTNHLTSYAAVTGLGATYGALLTSISFIGGTAGKMTLGRVGDKYGVKTALLIAEVSAIIGILLVIISPSTLAVLLPVGVCIFGYGASTTSLMGALLPKAVFGERDYTKILSYTNMAMSLGVGIISPAYGFIYDLTHSYLPGFFFAIGIAVLCLFAAFYAIDQGRKLMAEQKS